MNDQKRIKVLFIQVPPGGGSLIALYELLKHLPNSFEPVVLCYHKNNYSSLLESVSRVVYINPVIGFIEKEKKFSNNKILGVLQIQYRSLKNYFIDSRSRRLVLQKIISEINPNIIHHNNEIFLNRDAIRAGITTKIPQVVHERSLGNYGYNYVNLAADKFLMKKIAARIDITYAVAEHFDTFYPETVKNKIVLHDFVDNTKYHPAQEDANLKASLGINRNDLVITSIGRIIKWKGQHILIEAINLLKERLSNFKVLLVGPDDDGIGSTAYKEELKQLVEKYHLKDNIIFTGNRNDVAAIINLSNIIVHCSVKPEPQGLVVIEALMCNKPLIASGNGGSGELVRKYGGVGLEKVDAETLAQKLELILFTNAIPVINHQRLEQDFDTTQQLATLIKLYNKVLANNIE